MIVRKQRGQWCPIDYTLEVIGGKWTLNIIHALLDSTKRHTELSNCLGGVNPKTLTSRLRLLEKQGLVKRTVFQEIPPRVEYCLTDRGRDLSKVLSALKEVGIKWQGTMNRRPNADDMCELCYPSSKISHEGKPGNEAKREQKKKATSSKSKSALSAKKR